MSGIGIQVNKFSDFDINLSPLYNKYKVGRWGYNFETRYVATPGTKCNNRYNLFSALHELGHHHDGPIDTHYESPIFYSLKDTYDILMAEVGAWFYAEKCIKPKYRKDFWRFANECLETYRYNVKYLMGGHTI